MNDERAGRKRVGPTPRGARPVHVNGEGSSARRLEELGPPGGAQVCQEDRGSAGDREPLRRRPTLLRLLEQAREERGSPPLWDAVVARLDERDRRRNAIAPVLRLLDQIRERVDDQTWKLVLDFEWHASQEVLGAVEVGLELGYDHGRTAVLLQAQPGQGDGAKVLTDRLADLLGDADAEYPDIILALVATLQATVRMAHDGFERGGAGSAAARG